MVYALATGGPFRAAAIFRASAWCHHHRLQFLSAFLRSLNVSLHGCDIRADAVIGDRFHLVHTVGVVIGPIVAGTDLSVYGNVTIGSRGPDPHQVTIGDGVTLYSGCVIAGSFPIGSGAVVGANAVVLSEVRPGATVVGAPAREVGTGTE